MEICIEYIEVKTLSNNQNENNKTKTIYSCMQHKININKIFYKINTKRFLI